MADVKMFYIEDDIKKIQTKTNLYVQQYGPQGAFHLSREIIQNAIDECVDPESKGSEINITLDLLADRLTCEDDGRGFPETDYPLDIFCTKNQSGSKFFRDQGGDSSGEFGVGATVVNALSDEFILRSYRDKENYEHTIKFHLGEKVEDTMVDLPKKGKRHGSMVSFIPSKRFLGMNTKFPHKEMIEWVKKMTYFIRKKNMKITFDLYNGLELLESYKFTPVNFSELLDTIVPDTSYSPMCAFSGDNELKETVRKSWVDKQTNKVMTKDEEVTKKLHLDIAFRYVSESMTVYDTYCNYTNTVDGGVHQNAFERCFCNYMQNKAKATMTEAQKEKTPIIWDDVRSGLCCVINLSTNAQVGFVGNAKTKIGNEELTPKLAEIINENLDEYFSKNPGCLNEYIKIVKLNAKARIESAKVKVAVQKERMNNFKEHEMKNLIMCTNKGKQWKEIN